LSPDIKSLGTRHFAVAGILRLDFVDYSAWYWEAAGVMLVVPWRDWRVGGLEMVVLFCSSLVVETVRRPMD
jgi:hypothetical protein